MTKSITLSLLVSAGFLGLAGQMNSTSMAQAVSHVGASTEFLTDALTSSPVEQSGIRSLTTNAPVSPARSTFATDVPELEAALVVPSKDAALVSRMALQAPIDLPFSGQALPAVTEAVLSQPLANDLFKKPQVSPLSIETLSQPTLVAYDDFWVVEFNRQGLTKQDVLVALEKILLSPSPFDEVNYYQAKPFNPRTKPLLKGRVQNLQGQEVRFPAQARDYAAYLYQTHAEAIRDDEGEFIHITLPLKPQQTGHRTLAESKLPFAKQVALQSHAFGLAPELIYAIMEVESGFNPKAVSTSKAMGLMQVKANAAGRDVYALLDAKPGMPSADQLFDPDENIRLGVAYLSLLQDKYLMAVENEQARKLLSIASYNGGLSPVLGIFSNNRGRAIQRINSLTSAQVYRHLTQRHPSAETRAYLPKVLAAEKKYLTLL